MDLGIKGKRAIVCASSKGLGLGCALSLAEAGVDLIINSRNPQNLESAARLLKSKYQVRVETVVADITTKEGQEAVLKKAENNLDIWSQMREVRHLAYGVTGADQISYRLWMQIC